MVDNVSFTDQSVHIEIFILDWARTSEAPGEQIRQDGRFNGIRAVGITDLTPTGRCRPALEEQ